MKELLVLNKYFWRYKWRFLLGIIFVVSSNYFRILQPNLVGDAIDQAAFQIKNPDAPVEHLVYLKFGGLLIFYAIISGLFTFLMRKTIIVSSRVIEFDLRNDILKHYTRLSSDFFKRNNTGDLMSRISEDVNKVRMYLGPAIMYGINLISLFVIAMPIMYSQNKMLTLYSLAPLPFLSFSIYYVSSIINKKSKKVQEQLSNLNVAAQESFSGIRVLKSYQREPAMNAHFEDESNAFLKVSMSLFKTEAFFFPLILLLTGASTIIVLWIGGKMVIDGNAKVGDIARFVIYINMLTWPVTSVGWVAAIIQSASASQKRINEFMNESPSIDEIENATSISRIDTVEFDHVDMTYHDTGINALNDISVKISSGEKIAIIGKTGSGKTTFGELLLRMIDASEGQVLVNGIPIKDLSLSSLRDSISYVPQDVFLFSDTVENNIRFSDDTISSSSIIKMAKNASVHDDIIHLKEQYDTLVGERGVTLSGGQKQRVAIARALIKKSDFILFDDCLSAVDAKTEEAIVSYLDDYLTSKTAVFITHRLPKTIVFDKIIVLEDGKMTAVGTHNELINKNQHYTELYNVNVKPTE